MRVSLLVGTFGSDEWRDRGDAAFARAVRDHDDACEHRRLHLPVGTLADVRNELARNATGDHLCFVDGDDRLAPGYLEAMRRELSALAHGDVRVGHRHLGFPLPPLLLVPAVQYVSVTGKPEGPPAIPAWRSNLIDLNCCVIGTLIPRALFNALGGFRELPALEDWDLTLRAVKAGAKLVAVPDAVYVAYRSASGRNLDQSPYEALRAEHGPGFPWHATARYKIGDA